MPSDEVPTHDYETLVDELKFLLAQERAARTAAEDRQHYIHQREQAHRQTLEQLRVIVSSIHEGITAHDRHGHIVFANDAAARVCGFTTTEELINAPREEVFRRFEMLDDKGQPFPVNRLPGRRIFEGDLSPEPVTLHIRNRVFNRTWWTLLRASPVLDAHGRPDLAVNVWHDISAERQQQEAVRFLSEASAALSASLDHASTLESLAHLLVPDLADWCVVHLLNGDKVETVAVAHVNPEKVALVREIERRWPMDLARENGVPKVLRTGVSELYTELSDKMLVLAARDQEHLSILRNIGLRSAMIVPLKLPTRTIGALTLMAAESGRHFNDHDLTLSEELGRRAAIAVEHARLFGEAQTATDRAERAVRIREEFLAIAGHELKTPLAALSLQLQGLQAAFRHGMDASSADKYHERLAKTLGYVDRLERLMSQLLDVSRISSGRLVLDLEEVDLAALAQEVLNRHQDELSRAQARVNFSCAGRALGRWDRERMDQVLSNLLSNAVKYGSRKPIDIHIEGGETTTTLTVQDHGIGISQEDRARIFERFERAVSKRNYGGFGVGLWIVQQIVRAHGGSISVESELLQGAKFVVTLTNSAERESE